MLIHEVPFPDSTRLRPCVQQEIAREERYVPATIGIIDGVVHAGMTPDDIAHQAADGHARNVRHPEGRMSSVAAIAMSR